MLFIFLNFVSLSSTLVCFEKFELNKNELPHVLYVVGTHLCANHTPVLTFYKVPRNLQHTSRMESTRKKLRTFHCRKNREAKSRPTGIPILWSAATPNGFVTRAAQWTQRNRPFAKWWRIRPPGPTISKTPRSFSCCWFAIPIAHFSKRSVQIMPGLMQTKILNMNLEKDEIISLKSTCA